MKIHEFQAKSILARSGTLTYEAIQQVTKLGYGQSTAVGQGGDPIIGPKFIDLLRLFKEDDETEAGVYVVVSPADIGSTLQRAWKS